MTTRRAFLGSLPLFCTDLCRPPSAPPPPVHPHAALYLYTEPHIRPRHRAVVQQALQRRRDAHTSAWQESGGKPTLAIGALKERAYHWHGEERVMNKIKRAWPFVAVVEFARNGGPAAFLDCFRRPGLGASKHDDGWQVDPAAHLYADHHNRQVVTGQDERVGYFAVPDTPSGDHVGESEFVIRARVQWQNGARAQLGWWFWFDVAPSRPAAEWRAVQVPLVDWRVTERTPKLGATATAAVDDPDRQLAVRGTERVFTFPVMPAGIEPGRPG